MNREITQNTPEWLELRRKKIGASDAPIILEVSPWKTPYQLWLEKTTGAKSSMSPHQKRGHDLEEPARRAFEKKTGLVMFPKVMLHPSHHWIDGKTIVEIKCPGQADHDLAKAGAVPEKYFPQLQHQLAVTGLKMMFYFSFDETDGAIVEVERDNTYIANMVELEKTFWQCLESCTPPSMNERDFVNHEEETWLETSQKWLTIHEQLETLGNEEKALRKSLIQMAGAHNAIGGGIRVTRSLRKGNIQYGKIPELQDLDLEQYRKEPSEVWRLTAV